MSISRCHDSLGAHAMCGVMMQLSSPSRGLSEETGSTDTTSTAAAYTLPAFSAFRKSCSTISGPLEILTSMTPSFTLEIVSLFMMPWVPGSSGQCNEITSLLRAFHSAAPPPELEQRYRKPARTFCCRLPKDKASPTQAAGFPRVTIQNDSFHNFSSQSLIICLRFFAQRVTM